jgi:hypothetical protein
MWEPRRLTTLRACTACYRDSFTFLLVYMFVIYFLFTQEFIYSLIFIFIYFYTNVFLSLSVSLLFYFLLILCLFIHLSNCLFTCFHLNMLIYFSVYLSMLLFPYVYILLCLHYEDVWNIASMLHYLWYAAETASLYSLCWRRCASVGKIASCHRYLSLGHYKLRYHGNRTTQSYLSVSQWLQFDGPLI